MSSAGSPEDGAIKQVPTAKIDRFIIEQTPTGVVVTMPPSGFGRIPWMIKLGGASLLFDFLFPSIWGFLVPCTMLWVATATLFAKKRMVWRVEAGELLVTIKPIPGGRRWRQGTVLEAKRSHGDTGLLLNVRGKGWTDVECAGTREVLEKTAAALNEALSRHDLPV